MRNDYTANLYLKLSDDCAANEKIASHAMENWKTFDLESLGSSRSILLCGESCILKAKNNFN